MSLTKATLQFMAVVACWQKEYCLSAARPITLNKQAAAFISHNAMQLKHVDAPTHGHRNTVHLHMLPAPSSTGNEYFNNIASMLTAYFMHRGRYSPCLFSKPLFEDVLFSCSCSPPLISNAPFAYYPECLFPDRFPSLSYTFDAV